MPFLLLRQVSKESTNNLVGSAIKDDMKQLHKLKIILNIDAELQEDFLLNEQHLHHHQSMATKQSNL